MQFIDSDNYAEVFKSTDIIKTRQVCALLSDNNIIFVHKRKALNFTHFNDNQIFVLKDDYEKANELISFITIPASKDIISQLKAEDDSDFVKKQENFFIKSFIALVTFLSFITFIPLIFTLLNN